MYGLEAVANKTYDDEIAANGLKAFLYETISGLYKVMQIQMDINGDDTKLLLVSNKAIIKYNREKMEAPDKEAYLLERLKEIEETNEGVSTYMNDLAGSFSNINMVMIIYSTLSGLYRIMQIQAEIDKAN